MTVRDPDDALLQRILAHAEAGSGDAGPPETVDPRRYLDPARFAAEQQLFRRMPVAVCAASRVAEPGAYVTHDATGVPILVVRAHDGELRAFVNACRHRGTRLVDGDGQRRAGFTCPYHGWSYDDRGGLRSIPSPERFPQVDPARCGLVPLPVTTAFGLVFASATAGGSVDLAAAWGPAVEELGRLGLGTSVGWAERTVEVGASWKLALDASLENYHVPVAHRATIAPLFLRDGLVADRFPGAVRVAFPKRSASDARAPGARLRDHANVIWWLMPGTLVLIEPDHVQVMAVFPVAVDRMRIEGVTLIPEAPATEKARRHWDRNVELFWGAIEEDFAMMVRMQRGIGHLPALHFGTSEHAAAWVHAAIDAAVGPC
jgi:phenylpropionate dioxygenase-like ring-hydroxylating dioxygenase large terminal subunit